MPRGEDAAKQKTLMRGVLVLLPAALFTKCVGLFYKIPLLHIVGVSGMAYFLAAYHVYSLLFLLSSTGLPTALSLQIARAVARGERRAVRRIFLLALWVFLGIGVCGSVCLLLFAPQLAVRLAMRDAAAAIMAIAPALALSAFLGAAKGYFQGHQQMGATALSEVLEAAGKLVFGLCFALYAKGRGYTAPLVAAHAIFGITVGMALAALVLCVWLLVHAALRRGGEEGAPLQTRRAVLSELLRVALPITLSAAVIGLVSLVDTALISGRLQAAGLGADAAHRIYSSYGNLAVPLYNLVPSLLSPVTLALMPLLGAAMAGGDREGVALALHTARRVALFVAVPAALGLAVFSAPVLSLIYQGQEEAVRIATPTLRLLALSVLPSALMTLMGAVLQATGHTLLPVVATGVGAAVKLVSEWVLLCVPRVYILGAPISTLLCTLTVLLIELFALSHYLRFRVLPLGDLLRPLAAALPAVALGAFCYRFLCLHAGDSPLLLLPVLPIVLVCYLALALPAGALTKRELLALPFGERLCPFLEKTKLLK